MYLIIWEYIVKPEHLHDFKRIYASNGEWVRLFRKSEGYLGTELLTDEGGPNRFVTIDRWTSIEAHARFKASFQTEYETLDAECESMTERETLIGKYSSS